MNFISIQTPNEHKKNEWKVCQIIKLEVNQFKNKGVINVKGVARSNSVTTLITVPDFNTLLKGEIIDSLHGYFKLKLEHQETKKWMQEAFKIL